ncbi:copper homeostasis protein CutC [Consotaella salsifontis]|uniref:PF03932 family protein CutC n=1 Tax=Consotaella salsifontis TaxID=1365950 RepID=A0A1T4SPZ6_9HYPH|nr:copper homeostasis protein CutC [Consotaella salsifontis]SKA29958.1 copper homeostasis protein [Consotaella salsifontis]
MILEVCVDSADGLAAAIEGGADRVELCSALALGGLTPSMGLMRLAARAPIPVYAMIRPREGDFVFAPAEFEMMMDDIRAAREAGLAGVVLGASLPDNRLDRPLLAALMAEARGMGTTLHRAFDLTPDPAAALEEAVELGFERILTSGQAPTAPAGAALIARLQRQAASRIAIMAGSGIKLETAADLVASTGVHEVHASCSRRLPASTMRDFGFQSPQAAMTDPLLVRRLKASLAEISSDAGATGA